MTDPENSPTADWWCWTEDEPSTFRCRERGHDVRSRQPLRTGGIVKAGTPIRFDGGCVAFVLPGSESTSERLRQVQADLAASQADLTKALDDRDWWKQAAKSAQADVEQIARTADLLRAELATASKEVRALRAARQWIVARDGGRDCERCEQEIRRGEAYELLDAADALAHIHCPDNREGDAT